MQVTQKVIELFEQTHTMDQTAWLVNDASQQIKHGCNMDATAQNK